MSKFRPLAAIVVAFALTGCASSKGSQETEESASGASAAESSSETDETDGSDESSESAEKEEQEKKEKDDDPVACRVEYFSGESGKLRLFSESTIEDGHRVRRKTRKNPAHASVDAEEGDDPPLASATKWEWNDGEKVAEWSDADGDGNWEQMVRWSYDGEGRVSTIEHDRATDGLGADDRDGKPERTELISWEGDQKKKVEVYRSNPMRESRRKLVAVEKWEWSEGNPVRKTKDVIDDGIGDEDEDGKPDQVVELEWKDGNRTARRTDRDGDGEFETVEKWEWKDGDKVRKTLDGGKWSEPSWKPDGEPNQIVEWKWEDGRKVSEKFDKDADGEWEETTQWTYDCGEGGKSE